MKEEVIGEHWNFRNCCLEYNIGMLEHVYPSIPHVGIIFHEVEVDVLFSTGPNGKEKLLSKDHVM